MMNERDAYQRAYAICRDALLAIATYGSRSMEEYLHDQGYSQTMLDAYKARGEWEHLRSMDYEIAEGALNRALEVLNKLSEDEA